MTQRVAGVYIYIRHLLDATHRNAENGMNHWYKWNAFLGWMYASEEEELELAWGKTETSTTEAYTCENLWEQAALEHKAKLAFAGHKKMKVPDVTLEMLIATELGVKGWASLAQEAGWHASHIFNKQTRSYCAYVASMENYGHGNVRSPYVSEQYPDVAMSTTSDISRTILLVINRTRYVKVASGAIWRLLVAKASCAWVCFAFQTQDEQSLPQ